MTNLIKYLEQFAACYEGDARGLAEDFELVVGVSMNELCDRLADEIQAHKEIDEAEANEAA